MNRLAILALLTASAAIAQTVPAGPIDGTWSNPSSHVHVRIAPCGPHICGTVVYANDSAKADAAIAGTTELIGLSLFQEFEADPSGGWRGKVMVPDLRKTVSGRIRVVDANTLDIEGCMFGHIACKDQKWTRVA
jgi:uncharacterized protein (DUF2147 family)